MRSARFYIFYCLISLCLMVGIAGAGEVRVFKPMEEGLSPMAIRSQALAEGFAQAVLEETILMLPGSLGEVRTEILRQYLLENAKPYIQGYKIISTQAQEAGLILRLDVRVNKTTLRDGLKRMGLFATIQNPQFASVTWPEDFDEESLVKLQELMTLTGIQQAQDVLPSIVFEYGPEKTYKAHIELEKQEWVSTNKNMDSVWFDLWARFFMRSEISESRTNIRKISVSGWFSPDAALEFDRVLRSWDSAVQEVELVELDMQPTGVGGSWEVRLLNGDRLKMLLQGFLPQRGLSYLLSEDFE